MVCVWCGVRVIMLVTSASVDYQICGPGQRGRREDEKGGLGRNQKAVALPAGHPQRDEVRAGRPIITSQTRMICHRRTFSTPSWPHVFSRVHAMHRA